MTEFSTTQSGSVGGASAQPWLTLLRWMLLGLVVWDVAFGCYALAHPNAVGPLAENAPSERVFVRIIGLFWLFMAYVQFVGWRDPLRNLLAVQLAVTLRLPTALLNVVEAAFLFPGPISSVHHHMLIFAGGDLFVWLLGACCLRRLGKRWWAW